MKSRGIHSIALLIHNTQKQPNKHFHSINKLLICWVVFSGLLAANGTVVSADATNTTEGNQSSQTSSITESSSTVNETASSVVNTAASTSTESSSTNKVTTQNTVSSLTTNNSTTTTTQASSSDESIDSWMPDKNLQEVVAAVLKVTSVDKITKEDMADITDLSGVNRNIKSLEGLEYATSLTSLNISGNQISDISPLAKLSSLTDLNLSDNQISDISPIANLKSLTYLNLNFNKISDFSTIDGDYFFSDNIGTASVQDVTASATTATANYIMDIPIKINTSGQSITNYITPHSTDDDTRYVSLDDKIGDYFNKDGKLEFDNLSEGTHTIVIAWEGQEPASLKSSLSSSDSQRISGTYTLTLDYEKQTGGDITVNYIDASGNKIHDPQIVSGYIGDTYDVSTDAYKLALDGYTLKGATGNINGQFTDQPQTITYIYNKNESPVNPDTPSTPVTPDNPITPINPSEPVNPATPNPTTPLIPSSPNSDSNAVLPASKDSSTSATQNTSTQEDSATLPATGELNTFWMTLSGIIGILMLGLLSIIKFTHKKD
ncbi:MucBP domain-containing protein [Ligilactobacillus sp. WILCCON 0076]|uniref:MucBP domain-containing protein n=1 Tax=Ligilactobacillus ubinensis TaxID=2876789 RepID=A0A9X2FLN7_9LACO|nr:MucBP domain-containing protein [Ligilactobacillus ubinensis]MCP0887837.1 MucBP domain-containing protein [Ligilactobacillus ubinensis]